ncbi:hypothetical protein RIVM261_032640 [Rivularia sp. IAM M-261]|nr:hypothetical protein RIVM261_032640 [Rivularia sp. IAM M-261]
MVLPVFLVLASAILSVAFPLATYTFTLAVFGFAHVATELRYINNRFNRRLNSDLHFQIIQLLLIIFLLRVLQVCGIVSSLICILLELSCVIGLIILVIPTLINKNWLFGTCGIILCIALMIGVYMAPTLTLLLFAVLHNITPVGFIAEKLRGIERNRAIIACFIVFFLIPLIIVSGLPYKLFSSINFISLEASLIQAGGLENNLAAYIPKQMHNQKIAIDAFSAAVFLQCMHYAVVIGILNKWNNHSQLIKANNPQKHQKLFSLLTILISTLLFFGFVNSFAKTRAIYGIVAAIHAWIEIPILLLSLVPNHFQEKNIKPATNEAILAIKDINKPC